MAEHFSYTQTVARMAENTWGREFASKEAAEREMLNKPQDMTAMAMLELMRRFNKFIECMADPEPYYKPRQKPANARAFPGKAVGEMLWCGSLDEGFCSVVITAIDAEGYAIIAETDFERQSQWRIAPDFATEYYHASLAEALAASAKNEIEYSEPSLAAAKNALAAIDAGEDLTKFLNGTASD